MIRTARARPSAEVLVLTSAIRFRRTFYDDATWDGVMAPQGLVRLVP